LNLSPYLFILCILSVTTLLLLLLLLLSSSSSSLFIVLVQRIYNCVPQTNHALWGYNIAAAMLLQCIVHTGNANSPTKSMYFYISTLRSTCAVLNMAVCCIALMACFPGLLLSYFLNHFEMVSVTHTFNGKSFDFAFHSNCVSVVRSSYFKIFGFFSW
jgi:hypothetical protein